MSRRTRLFIFVSGGILAAGLGTGLVTAYVGGFQNLGILGGAGPDEFSYLPSDARVVAFANVREIMDSELHQKLRDLTPRSDHGLSQFEQETGVDVTRDVDVVFASIGGPDGATAGGEPQGPPLVMARGRFDNVRIEGFVRSRGGQVEDYRGVRFLALAESSGPTDAALAFVEPGLIAMGSEAAVRRAIDAHNGDTTSASSNADLMRLVNDANNGNAWVVARFDSLVSGGHIPQDMLQRLPAINWLSVTGHVNGGVRAAVKAEARDEVAAKNLREVLQGILALAKLQTGQQADITTLVNSIELGGDGTTVSLGLSVPIEFIDRLVALRTAAGVLAPPPAPDDVPVAPEEPAPAP